MNGADIIRGERVRQIVEDGYDVHHDALHTDGSLAVAGGCYAIWGHYGEDRPRPVSPEFWPWDAEEWKPTTERVRALAKAGALIAAEIDRLLRLERA